MARKVVIVGGVAGGASCAARLRRLDEAAEITMIERGPYISFANCGLPYHVSGKIADRDDLLVQTAEGFRKRFNATVLTQTEAVRIDREQRIVRVRDLTTGAESDLRYDDLVLSPGAEPLKPPAPGVDLPGVFTLRNIPDLDKILEKLREPAVRRAVVVGAGFIGVEMAENLVEKGLSVTLVEMAGQVMPSLDREMAAFLEREMIQRGVQLRLGSRLASIAKAADGLEVRLEEGLPILADLVLIGAGVRPEVRLAQAAELELGASGGIRVDASFRTNDPRIFAVGDAIEVKDRITGANQKMPLAGPANRQGRMVADILAGRPVSYPGTLGTNIVKVFDWAGGSVGLSERQARAKNISFLTAWTHGQSHASYYPGASLLSMKLLFEAGSGRVLGAQVVGKEGVDKRLDVLATSIAGRMTVFDLEQLDLAYAPPFSSAKDPVNVVAAVAASMLRGDHPTFRWDEVGQREGLLLDVRSAEEFECGTIEGSKNIPLDELRSRLGELPRDQKILVFCQIGLRGYLATRILLQHGFQVFNLLGGYRLWQTASQAFRAVPVQPRPTPLLMSRPVASLDVRGKACPGPVLALKSAIEGIGTGDVLEILASDPGFMTDLPAWVQRTGHSLLDLQSVSGEIRARVQKQGGVEKGPLKVDPTNSDSSTLVVFSGELDRALAAMIIANGAAAMGKKVTLFFTFWGLNVLRRSHSVPLRKTILEKMFGWMMPQGAQKAPLSKMHFGGVGTWMMRYVMNQKNVSSLSELIETAKASGVRFVACQMSMDVMGIRREELIDGIEIGGVAAYLAATDSANHNLFI